MIHGGLAALLAISVPIAVYWLTLERGLQKLEHEAQQQLDIVAAELFQPAQKYSYFPPIVARHPLVLAASLKPADRDRARKANLLLSEFNLLAGSEVVYLIGADGTTIASSNWDRPDSFVGHNFSFRPYFKDALNGQDGRFYAMGTVSRAPGYYLSHPVRDGTRIAGVIVVKVDLSQLDRQWAKNRHFEVTVSDENSIVFLSSVDEWKYRPLRPLTEAQMRQLGQNRQYGPHLGAPLELDVQRPWPGTNLHRFRVSRVGHQATVHEDYVLRQKSVEQAPWTVSVYFRADAAEDNAVRVAVISALIPILFGVLVMYWREQRRRVEEHNAAQQSMQVSHERFRIVSKATSDVVWDWDLQNDLLSWNENMESTFGHLPEELEPGGASWANRIHPDDRQRVLDGIHAVIDGTTERWSDEYRFLCRDERVATVFDRGFVIRDSAGKAIRMVGSISDISHRKESEQAIHRLAFYDSLTGLPNRSHLLDRLHDVLAANARAGLVGAVLFIDLDNFKALNDTLGHHKGDLMLSQVAARLSGCVRDSDTLGRLGGDEFVIMLDRLSASPEEAAARAKIVAQKVLDAFVPPFNLEGVHWHASPSIGISLLDSSAGRPDDILRQADLAMYAAKAGGRNTLRFFAPQMEALAHARSGMESALRRAIAENEFMLYFQPQCDRTGRIHGAEALLRWRTPDKGFVPPPEFIPLAEQTGLIVPIGNWVLRQACHTLVDWARSPATADWTVAVNVSAVQFYRSDFVAQVRAIIDETGVNARLLKLEVTESALITDIEEAIVKMQQIQALGVEFSLDDFGTGYSSLAYLNRLPISQLKIDRSFVAQVPGDAAGAAIVATIIALGRTLGLSVIAEGVETEAQLAYLAERACDSYQGYLFGRPMTVGELIVR